jgi:hypothetical protein
VLSCAETAHGRVGIVGRCRRVGALEAYEAVAAVLGAGLLAEQVVVERVGAGRAVIYGSSTLVRTESACGARDWVGSSYRTVMSPRT